MGRIIDNFGIKGGFTKIIDFFSKIASGEFKTSVEHVSYVLIFLVRTMPFWTR